MNAEVDNTHTQGFNNSLYDAKVEFNNGVSKENTLRCLVARQTFKFAG